MKKNTDVAFFLSLVANDVATLDEEALSLAPVVFRDELFRLSKALDILAKGVNIHEQDVP